jgi:hypothetical protein
MSNWYLTVVVIIIPIVTAIMMGTGTFATNTNGALGYLTREAADEDQTNTYGMIINEARTNIEQGLLCKHLDINSLCVREHGQASSSPINLSVPIRVIVPINNTNNNIINNNNNNNNNSNINNNKGTSSTLGYAIPPINTTSQQMVPNLGRASVRATLPDNINITIPPVGTTSQQMVPNLGRVSVSTTLPDARGYCIRGQFHANSNFGPVCLSILLMK